MTNSYTEQTVKEIGTCTMILGDSLFAMNGIKDDSVDLIIADPPYWKVVAEKWDYVWRTEEEYIEWSLRWISLASRKLRLGGSFYLFGYFRTLAHLVPHFDKMGLELRQQIIVDKGMRSVSGRATKGYKIFPNTTESIMFMIKDAKPFIKQYLKEQQQKIGMTSKEINEALGVKSNGGGMWSIYTGKNICEQVPTRELWERLQKVLRFDLEYEKIAQVFNAEMGVTDVWQDIDFYKEDRYHPTQKPIKLINRLVQASSNEGMTVLDPFLGAGSTLLSCQQLNRNGIGIEVDLEYFRKAESRLLEITNPTQGTLFV